MYQPGPPGPPRPRQWTTRRTTLLLTAAVIVAIAVAAARWFGARAVQHTLSPSVDPVLARLRQVPRPPGAVEVGHRTLRGSYHSNPSAWLTYRVPDTACPAALSAFLTAGASEQGPQAADPVASFCKPVGKGYESFCLPAVCFFADFMSDHNPAEYTISTGPDAEG